MQTNFKASLSLSVFKTDNFELRNLEDESGGPPSEFGRKNNPCWLKCLVQATHEDLANLGFCGQLRYYRQWQVYAITVYTAQEAVGNKSTSIHI